MRRARDSYAFVNTRIASRGVFYTDIWMKFKGGSQSEIMEYAHQQTVVHPSSTGPWPVYGLKETSSDWYRRRKRPKWVIVLPRTAPLQRVGLRHSRSRGLLDEKRDFSINLIFLRKRPTHWKPQGWYNCCCFCGGESQHRLPIIRIAKAYSCDFIELVTTLSNIDISSRWDLVGKSQESSLIGLGNGEVERSVRERVVRW